MSSLLEALSEGTYDLQNKRDLSTDFSRQLLTYREQVVNAFLHDEKIDLNKTIAEVVKRDGLNSEQTKRIVEEVNNQVYLILYNRIKSDPEREVVFDLADFNKVDSIVKNSGVKIAGKVFKKASHIISSSLEKTASINEESDDENSDFGFFNSDNVYDAIGSSERISMKNEIGHYKHSAEKVLSQFKKCAAEEESIANDILDDATTIGEALVEYSKKGCDTQHIFERLSKEASLSPKCQTLFKSSCDDAIKLYQKEYKLPEKYAVKLAYVNSNEPEKYSLGKYSLCKVASVVECPMIHVNGRGVNNFGTLVKIAEDVVGNLDKLGTVRNEKQSILQRMAAYGIEMDDLEKMASCGRSWVQNLVDAKK